MRAHRIKSTGIPMPEPVKGAQGPRLQGGLPPIMKNCNSAFFMAHAKGTRNRLAGFYDPRKESRIARHTIR